MKAEKDIKKREKKMKNLNKNTQINSNIKLRVLD